MAVAVLIHNIEASSDNITAILNEALETASSLTVSLNSMQGVFDVFLAMIPSVSTILNVLVFGFCGAYTFVVMCVLSWSAFETYTGLRLSLVFASTLGLSTGESNSHTEISRSQLIFYSCHWNRPCYDILRDINHRRQFRYAHCCSRSRFCDFFRHCGRLMPPLCQAWPIQGATAQRTHASRLLSRRLQRTSRLICLR